MMSTGAVHREEEFSIRLTEVEWTTLRLAPVWAYQAVAEADQEASEPEAEALGRQLMAAASRESSSELVRRAFGADSRDLGDLMATWRADSRHFDVGLRDAASILAEKIPAREAASFKEAVIELARAVGLAGGGLVPEEVIAIGMVEAALGIEGASATVQSPEAPPVQPAPRPVGPAPAASAAEPTAAPSEGREAFVAARRQFAGSLLRGIAMIALIGYFLAAWAEGSQSTGTVEREIFLVSTPTQYLVPGLAYLVAPILLALIGPWLLRPRFARISRADRQALRTFKYRRRELAGLRPIYARRHYALRVALQIALWVVGIAFLILAVVTFRNDHVAAEVNIGTYVAVGLSGLGLLGAVLMLPSRAVLPVRVGRDGSISPIER
jgi:hypothetical protein